MTRLEHSARIRRHVAHELYDEARGCASRQAGIAIYWLADPRDLRRIRYVGQTSAPRRRFLQHLNTARLWLPDERPWWIKDPTLRPLYDWIRVLYQDDFRLPTMGICGWEATRTAARLAERARICECLAVDLPLLNIEAQQQIDQYQLL
jgi:hypothetical protein